MGEKISDALLTQLSAFVSERMGLHFTPERRCYLEQGIVSAARDLGFEDAEACARWLIAAALDKSQIEMLASYLTVGETYFFRESRDFEIFERHIFSELINSRRERGRYLRVWCAGCATGEEPYSIAILLHKMLPDLKDWHITLLATDINNRFLRKAAEGKYTEWSFRNTPEWVRKGYFQKAGSAYEILPHIKKMVTFSYLNLIDDAYPALLNNTNAMDVIFCRNVLMYFSPERISKVAGNFHKALVNSGWLIVSPVEMSRDLFPQYISVNITEHFFYRKESMEAGREPGLTRSDKAGIPAVIDLQPPVSIPPASVPLPSISKPEPPVPASAAPELSLYEEASALYEQGLYEAAIERLSGLAEEDSNAKAMSMMAKAYANQGKLAEALVWCEKAISADKLSACCYYLRATILQELDQAEEAVKALKQALYLDPDFILAYFALGNLSRQQGKLKEADRYFKNALSLLSGIKAEDILQDSEGITAGRLREIIEAMKQA